MDRLKEYLHKYINNPHDPYINAELGEEYEKIGQGAASLSYFLRAAELLHTYDPEMAYCCVLKTWKQLHNTKRRPDYEREQLQTAVAYLPTRPEAYYHLSKIHSSREEWKTSYMYSCLGLQYTNSPPLEYDVGYPGDYMLIFQKAFTSWSSSRELHQEHLSRPVSSSRLWTATLSRAPRTCCSSTRGSGPQSSTRSRSRSRKSGRADF